MQKIYKALETHALIDKVDDIIELMSEQERIKYVTARVPKLRFCYDAIFEIFGNDVAIGAFNALLQFLLLAEYDDEIEAEQRGTVMVLMNDHDWIVAQSLEIRELGEPYYEKTESIAVIYLSGFTRAFEDIAREYSPEQATVARKALFLTWEIVRRAFRRAEEKQS